MATVVKEEDPKHIGACKHDKNARRDVISNMAKHSKHAPLYSSKITLWDEKNSRPIKVDAYFFCSYMRNWITCTLTCRQVTSARWRLGGAMETRMNKWKEATNFGAGDAAGFGVWGDAGAFSTRDSLFILLWNVITCGVALRTRNPFVCFFKAGYVQV